MTAALRDTIERFTAMAADGVDVDFGRGQSANDTWWGDPALTGRVDATLGSVEVAPFYAIEVHSGSLGTKGGPRTDVNGQVLDVDENPLPGLYAAGNAMSSAMGMTYGGAGGTLGPGMTFGYLAGRHAAGAAHPDPGPRGAGIRSPPTANSPVSVVTGTGSDAPPRRIRSPPEGNRHVPVVTRTGSDAPLR